MSWGETADKVAGKDDATPRHPVDYDLGAGQANVNFA